GDRNGRIGFGMRKALEVPEAIKKAIDNAKKGLVGVPIVGTTIPYEINGRFGSGNVLMKPAAEGTGVISGGPVSAVLELAVVCDIFTISLVFINPVNKIRVTTTCYV